MDGEQGKIRRPLGKGACPAAKFEQIQPVQGAAGEIASGNHDLAAHRGGLEDVRAHPSPQKRKKTDQTAQAFQHEMEYLG
jgi:hypothetical protein